MKEFLQSLHVETGTSPTGSVQCECERKKKKQPRRHPDDGQAAKNTGHRAALKINSLYTVLQGLLYIWHFKLNYALA